ncbi:Metallo-peptidase family M12-domain-containing protein [Fimicolochytrium jonesii]|uniref:Metallo-peptidase family M12-domain-containing protein n=1 Tax=Fimicolochytrium jonesii TaxID=1396493 RepID=UPI0022FEF362|nr:Metallo-peptidase family M12-domain-containing protein [Fimicolochytrium jonesii]KAI8826643.1 Metallo-peptidase family M12-domain-containing protein [Fimicolochytrium jonesii]
MGLSTTMSRALAVYFVVLLLIVSDVWAHSSSASIPPVRFYDFLEKVSIKKKVSGNLQLSFKAINETFTLDLEPNTDLLHSDAHVQYASDAEPNFIDLHRMARHAYKGNVVGKTLTGARRDVGWARIILDPSEEIFHGSFVADGQMYHVKEIETYHKTRRSVDIQVPSSSSRQERHRAARMILLRDRDESATIGQIPELSTLGRREDGGFTSGIESSCPFNPKDNLGAQRNISDRLERSLAGSLTKRAPAGCPTARKVLFMAVAADCTYVRLHNGKENALQQILENWNTASGVYERSFNINLGVIQVFLQDACTPTDPVLKWNRECSDSYSINQRLSDFSAWRGQKEKDDAGLWHLMTNCPTGPSVGVAWLKTLCETTTTVQSSSGGQQSVSGTGVSAAVQIEWKVVAHEIGHNFGAYHDCSGATNQCPCTDPEACDCCPCTDTCNCNGQFIMHPTDSSKTDNFSPCSINQICGGFPKFGTCLKEPGALKTIATGICGNGIREGSEQCDCGTAADCAADPCCDVGCKLKPAATCSDKNDECCASCKLKPSGTTCRASSGECDIPETCNGVNATCPTDTFKPDRSSCTTTTGIKAQCANGQCTSRDLQCKSEAAASLTLSGACPDQQSQCQLFCQAGTQCVVLQSYFVDGTPCGLSGKAVCKNGDCTGGNILDDALGWIKTNKTVAIPILVIAGLLILSILYSIVRCCCCPSSRRPPKQVVGTGRHVHGPTTGAPSNWVEPEAYNGHAVSPSNSRPPAYRSSGR